MELLIVIVVIAILVAITVVAFRGVQSQARTASVKSDLEAALKASAIYQVEYGYYAHTVSTLKTAGLKLSKDAYGEGAIICHNTDSSIVAFVADVKGGKSYYISSEIGSIAEYTWNAVGGTSGSITCSNIGLSNWGWIKQGDTWNL